MKGPWTLAKAEERFEVESNLVDGPSSYTDVVAFGPGTAVVEVHLSAEGTCHSTYHWASHCGASNAPGEGLGSDERRRLLITVVLGQKPVDHAGAKQKPIVGSHMEHMAFYVVQRDDRTLRIRPEEPSQQPLGFGACDAHRVGDGVHGATSQERDAWERLASVDVEKPGEGHVVGAVASADAKASSCAFCSNACA